MYFSEHEEGLPFISTACPSVVRLIRVRFPNLIPHLLPLNPPVEVAAVLAAQRAMEKTGLPREKIGIIFISPCPSKVTYVKAPLGTEKSQVDKVLAIKDVYPRASGLYEGGWEGRVSVYRNSGKNRYQLGRAAARPAAFLPKAICRRH